MAIPTGAHHVYYEMSAVGPNVEVSVPITVDLRTSPTEADAAAQVAADAVLAHLRATFPTVNEIRRYECYVPGDTWPVP